jgi:mono/diheme cytochrome c family protein
MGALYPANPPDFHNGAKIFAEKCEPCHGSTGLGDGEKGKQLPITVAAIGLPDFAQKAAPSAWYMRVTQGNIERFMPPFMSLSDQERWDVVSYALMMHMKPEQTEKGKELFESKCADCAKKFSDPEKMYSLSELDLIKIIKNGEGDIPAFGKDFTDEEAAAVAMYIRTLTFAAPPAEPTATPVPSSTPTLESTPSTEVTPSPEGTPSAEATPAEGTPAGSTPEATMTSSVATGSISGLIDNKTGEALPSGGTVTLFGYEHNEDPTVPPVESVKLEGVLNADGTYRFDNVEIPENRIFLAEIKVNGVTYQSEFVVVKSGMTELTLPSVVLYAKTDDFTVLKIDSLQLYFDFAKVGDAQIFALYSIKNDSDKTVTVKMSAEKQQVPFIAFPKDAAQLGFQAAQDSAPFVQTEDGFSMPPNKTPYGLVAFASVPKGDEVAISQVVLLPVDEVTVYLPEGMEAEGKTLTDDGIQTVQEIKFHVYKSGKMKKDESIEFTITGAPKSDTEATPDVTQNKNLLIGVGGFGLVLILVGVWLFMRDRSKGVEEESAEENESEKDDEEFADSESIMDAVIALDDLHRAGKISDEAYQKRRAELKNALKRK